MAISDWLGPRLRDSTAVSTEVTTSWAADTKSTVPSTRGHFSSTSFPIVYSIPLSQVLVYAGRTHSTHHIGLGWDIGCKREKCSHPIHGPSSPQLTMTTLLPSVDEEEVEVILIFDTEKRITSIIKGVV